MTVQKLVDTMGLKVFQIGDLQREIRGGYCGDLLSWVMGRAGADYVWLTIMTNGNVAAVASLADVACVLLTEGVEPDPDLITKAGAHGITLLGCPDGTYEGAVRVASILRGQA